MKIAVVSDIHGNHFALKKVLDTARKEKADKLLVLGDICGYYYHPDKCLQLIEEWPHELIKGNHEDLLFELKQGKIEETQLRDKYGSGHRLAMQKLTDSQITKITNAPEKISVQYDDITLLMCHGSPLNHNQYLYPDTGKMELEKCDVENVDLVLVGHSHYPFAFRNRFSTLINAGSVGQARNTGGLASWLMINTLSKTFEIKATPYATIELEKEVKLVDPENKYLLEILTRNRNDQEI
jgi:putative phosphoesterase